MASFIFLYVAGALTIIGPWTLPVLPFAFSRATQPFIRGILPMLIGLALTFTAVAGLAAVDGNWTVWASEIARYAALALLVLFGIALFSKMATATFTRRIAVLGSRLSGNGEEGARSICGSLLLGIATGLLWAPSAAPILGSVLAGAELHGAIAETVMLLAVYIAGAATSLALALEAGGEVFAAIRCSLRLAERSGGHGRITDNMGRNHN